MRTKMHTHTHTHRQTHTDTHTHTQTHEPCPQRSVVKGEESVWATPTITMWDLNPKRFCENVSPAKQGNAGVTFASLYRICPADQNGSYVMTESGDL